MANRIAAASASSAPRTAHTSFCSTHTLYFITTASRDVIIAIWMTDRTAKVAKHPQLISARIPLANTPPMQSGKGCLVRFLLLIEWLSYQRHGTGIPRCCMPRDCSSASYKPSMAQSSHVQRGSRRFGPRRCPKWAKIKWCMPESSTQIQGMLRQSHTLLVSGQPSYSYTYKISLNIINTNNNWPSLIRTNYY